MQTINELDVDGRAITCLSTIKAVQLLHMQPKQETTELLLRSFFIPHNLILIFMNNRIHHFYFECVPLFLLTLYVEVLDEQVLDE